MRTLVALVVCCGLSANVLAQDDVIARARAASAAGNRAEALTLLEAQLAKVPTDVDARLIYGLVLSWERRYDDARRELSQVLATAPDYLDARVALMNVEWWSGNADRARDEMRLVLAADPGNTQARAVRRGLEAKSYPWAAGGTATVDFFNLDRDSWREFSLEVDRETGIGPLILRGSTAERFDLDDQQVDLEFYPEFRPGSYAFIGVGMASDAVLYPDYRVLFDFYQSVGGGFELSGGFRYLAFEDEATMYVASLTKYVGNWMITGKTSVVPHDIVGDEWSYYATARRYFGDLGKSYVGFGYSHGFIRVEPRGQGDLIGVNADAFRGQAEIYATPRLRWTVAISAGRYERPVVQPVVQTTLSAGLLVRF